MLEDLSKGMKKMIFLSFERTAEVIYLVAMAYPLFEKASFWLLILLDLSD